jgi:hemolysin-activating ACP:hemolysin acyltransferase
MEDQVEVEQVEMGDQVLILLVQEILHQQVLLKAIMVHLLPLVQQIPIEVVEEVVLVL